MYGDLNVDPQAMAAGSIHYALLDRPPLICVTADRGTAATNLSRRPVYGQFCLQSIFCFNIMHQAVGVLGGRFFTGMRAGHFIDLAVAAPRRAARLPGQLKPVLGRRSRARGKHPPFHPVYKYQNCDADAFAGPCADTMDRKTPAQLRAGRDGNRDGSITAAAYPPRHSPLRPAWTVVSGSVPRW
jgi:hypothetical protein